MTAAARYAIRAIAHWNPDPADVLARRTRSSWPPKEGRFVTAKPADLAGRDR